MRIAATYNYELEPWQRRFESFWYSFLKVKLLNLRCVHRLLSVTHFQASSLFQDGQLEVDLLDLVAIDYLRIFSPTTYAYLAANRLNSFWFSIHRSFSDDRETRVNSKAALALCSNSELGERGAFLAISHLFPDFFALLPEWSQSYRLEYNDLKKFKLSSADRPIWHDKYQPLYFQLNLDASSLPNAEYKRFLQTSNACDMIKLFRNWAPNGWRKQLFSLLESDPNFTQSPQDPYHFLLALSSISDELDSTESVFQNKELDIAARLWSIRLSSVPEQNRLSFIKQIFQESDGISIPLLVLEYLRKKSGLEYFDGIESTPETPVASSNEIESLSEILFPKVRENFFKRYLPVTHLEGYRFYRIVSGLGTKRMEEILSTGPDGIDHEACFAIVASVIINWIPRFNINLFEESSINDNTSKAVATDLLRFASAQFWGRFVDSNPVDEIIDFKKRASINHIKTGLKVIDT